MSFEQFNLDARLNAAIKSAGFVNPTPIQEQAIPFILEGRDVMGLAQTGTGKTAAFMLPILQKLTQGPLKQMRALVIAPTRELAEQINQATRDLTRNTKIRSAAIYGGVKKKPQIKALNKGTEIIIATPGRLLDLTGEGHVDYSHIEFFVLDEADRLFDMGFLPDIQRIIRKLPQERQTLFFSATMPKVIRRLANEELKNPQTVQIGAIRPAKTVSHALYPVTPKLKKNLLLHMLETTATGRVLIFTRTKYRARNLARDLKKNGYRAAELQGNMSQNQRQRAIDGFRKGRYDILAATDVAARGIDIDEISHVINFDMPDTADAYTHRIGRTGRAQNNGKAFTFAVEDDEAMVRQIERSIGSPIERRRLDGFDYGVFQPERVPEVKLAYSTPRGRRRRF
ncbi:MAG: DEAD/DEAH box helicase [Candidatus Promineifilaceae bacterium]|jgi:ATP-dependent RNA helicase RhlE